MITPIRRRRPATQRTAGGAISRSARPRPRPPGAQKTSVNPSISARDRLDRGWSPPAIRPAPLGRGARAPPERERARPLPDVDTCPRELARRAWLQLTTNRDSCHEFSDRRSPLIPAPMRRVWSQINGSRPACRRGHVLDRGVSSRRGCEHVERARCDHGFTGRLTASWDYTVGSAAGVEVIGTFVSKRVTQRTG